MVRPACFAYNPETAPTNAFQRPGLSGTAARAEFEGLAAALGDAGVSQYIADDTSEPHKPDALFPNNWVSFHADGTVVLYPMQAPSRRAERRTELLSALTERLGFRVSRVLDFTAHERRGRYLEGTGSLVLDHRDRIAYACRSVRTNVSVLEEWSAALGYEPLAFDAADHAGRPIYHTNVLMSIGEQAALVGLEAIAEHDRGRVCERLRASGRELIELSWREIEHFAGNTLELLASDEVLGTSRIRVMSEAARRALSAANFARIAACTDKVLIAPVPTVEHLGGGSVRCMLAEVFLPV